MLTKIFDGYLHPKEAKNWVTPNGATVSVQNKDKGASKVPKNVPSR